MENHQAGDAIEAYGIPIVLKKDQDVNERGNPVYDETGKPCFRCGFKIGGGIDMDPSTSPQGYPDKGVYVTYIYENGPAHRAGLQLHDKILQVNGHDMTVVTHKKAVDYIKRKPQLHMIVHRKGMTGAPRPVPGAHNPQFQQYSAPPGQQFPQYGGPPPGAGGQMPQQQQQQSYKYPNY